MTTSQAFPSLKSRPVLPHNLFWKELRENWLLSVWAVPFLICLFLAVLSYDNANRHGQSLHFEWGVLMGLLEASLFLSGLLCGSSIYSQELASGTKQFLASLPLSKQRIWWTKIFCAFFQLAISSLLANASAYLLMTAANSAGLLERDGYASFCNLYCTLLPQLLPFIILAFGVSSFVTFLIDRTVSTVVVSLITSVIVITCINEALLLLLRGIPSEDVHTLALESVCVITGYLFCVLSFQIFSRPEGVTCIVSAGKKALPGTVLILLTLLFSIWWLLH